MSASTKIYPRYFQVRGLQNAAATRRPIALFNPLLISTPQRQRFVPQPPTETESNTQRVMRGSVIDELEQTYLLDRSRAGECARLFYEVIQKQSHLLGKDGPAPDVEHDSLSDQEPAMACLLGEDRLGAPYQCRTGTKPYISHEEQDIDWKGPRRYRHDLESAFYVVTLFTFLYSSPSEKAPKPSDIKHQFERWHQEDDTTLRRAKNELLNATTNWRPPVTKFFTGFERWLFQLHMCFFYGFRKQREFILQISSRDLFEHFQLGRLPQIQQTQSFDEETLGGIITCEYMALTMHEFEGEELDTRSAEWQELLTQILKSSRAAA
ncbi:hypothetical protein C8R42DRAFT_320767 [Lentinula raphanica]|nr:hypothetical protein C8R42DRAFT_320767 [Lentinula raphanica]